MDKIEVRIEKLPPLRVAAALGYGEGPEGIAWSTLLAWAKEQGLLNDLDAVEFYGFNNPNPSPGSPNYGYEQWMTVGSDVMGSGDVDVKEFEGGLYAITRCQLRTIGESWQALAAWCEQSHYGHGKHQWLEKAISKAKIVSGEGDIEDNVLDLYMPIVE